MAAIYTTLFWCALQVTLFLLLAAPIYFLVRRRSPQAATFAAATSLAAVIALSALAASPWPRWTLAFDGREGVAVAAGSPTVATGDSEKQGASKQPNANMPSAEGAAANVESPLAALWQAVQFAATPAALSPDEGAQAAERRPQWPAFFAVLFLVGAAISGVRLVAGLIAVRKLQAGSQVVDDAALATELHRLCQELRVVQPVSLLESAEIVTPATVGWRRPSILLPPAWRTWDAFERRAVLAHELAHISQHDFAAWLIARAAIAVHFYHPLVRWFAGRLQLDQELAADAAAAGLLGDRQQYLHTLANLALATPMHRLAGPARTFIPGRSLLVRRVEMLRTNENLLTLNRSRGFWRWGGMLTATVTAIAIAGVRPELQAEEKLTSVATNEETQSIQISGTVVDVHGNPVPGAIIVCPQYDIKRTVAVTHSLSDGMFALETSAPTDRRMLLSAWAYAKGHGIRAVNLYSLWKMPPTDIADLVLTLPAVSNSEFVAFDPVGRPLAGAVVGPRDMEMPNGVYSADESTGLSGPIPDEIVELIQQTTDDEGRANFDAVPAALLESVRVETSAYGLQDFRRPKKELRLKAVACVEGAIVSSNPAALEGLEIYLRSDSGAGGEGEAVAVVDREGRFAVPALAAGRLDVRLAWPDHLPTQPEMARRQLLLEAGKTLQIEILERPAVTFHGRIVAGENRVPVRRAGVFVRHVHSPDFGQHVETDENGKFEAKSFSGETYIQVVSLGDDKAIVRDYDFPRIPNESVPIGVEELQLDDIVLQPKATLAGTLLHTDGSPNVNASVGLRRGNSFRHLAGIAETDADGEFRMPVSDWRLLRDSLPDGPNEWLLISQPESPQETPTRTPLKVVSEEPLVLQEQ